MTINELRVVITKTLTRGGSLGYTAISNEIIDTWMNVLSYTEFKVLLKIYRHTNTVTGSCYISQAKISEELGTTSRRSTVSDAIKALVNHNLIRVIPAKILKDGKLQKTSNEIIIIPPDKVTDTDFIASIDAMIDQMKFLTVEYKTERGKNLRRDVGTGEHTNCKTPSQMNAYTESRRQEAITIKEAVKEQSKEPYTIAEEDKAENITDEILENYYMNSNIPMEAGTNGRHGLMIDCAWNMVGDCGYYKKGLIRYVYDNYFIYTTQQSKIDHVKLYKVCEDYYNN